MYTLVGGINVAAPRQRFELVMQHDASAAKLRTLADNFEAMLVMRAQLSRLGYRFVSLLPVAHEGQ